MIFDFVGITFKPVIEDIYSDIAVLQISQNASQHQRQLLASLKTVALGNSSNIDVGDAKQLKKNITISQEDRIIVLWFTTKKRK